MTLSEVFYEAACQISEEYPDEDRSCLMVSHVARRHGEAFRRHTYETYAHMMGGDCCQDACSIAVENAADSVAWAHKDFRTFMLLMASEAVR